MNPEFTDMENELEFEPLDKILKDAESQRMGARLATSSDDASSLDGSPLSLEEDLEVMTDIDGMQTVPLQAQIAERRKRQQAEARLAELEKSSELQLQADGGHQENYARFSMSEELARAGHDDYDEVVGAVMQVLQSKPELLQELLSEPHPAELLYRLGQQWHLVDSAGGLDQLADRQFRAGYEKAMAEQQQNMRAYRAKLEAELLPPSFAETSAPGMREELEFRPTPLADILKEING